MRIGAAYIRVSTDDQLEYSPDAQLREIKKYAEKNDIILDERYIFIEEEGRSGRSTKKRDKFNDMIGSAKIKPRPFEVILLWKFSRFARNQEQSIVYKNMLRKQLGIDVISVSEPLMEGPFGSLIERIIEWMDEFYSINLSGEVVRGMTEKAIRGEFQTSPPLGYQKLPEQPLRILEEEAKYIRYIFDQYQAGMSFFAIAGKLNAMGLRTKRGNKIENRTVEYILNNPIYKGYVRWTPTGKTVGSRIYDSPDTITRKSDHAPIIPEEIFDEAAERLAADRARRSSGDRPAETKKHYLSGILKCGSCGSTLSYAQANDGFQCIKYTHGTCKPSHYVQATKIEKAILDELDRLSLPGVYIENIRNLADHSEERELIRKEIDSIERMFDRAKRAYLAEVDTLEEYESNKAKIQAEIEEKEAELAKIPVATVDQKAVKRKIMDARVVLMSDTTIANKNAALRETVEKITFSRPEETVKIFLYG